MTPGRRMRIALAWAAAFGCSASQAETLDEAWAQALQKDNGLAAVRGQAEAAGLDAEAAHAQRWPTLGLQGAYTKLDDAPAFDFSFTGLPIKAPEVFKNDQFVMGSATVTRAALHERAHLLEHRCGRGAQPGGRCRGDRRRIRRQAGGRRCVRRRAARAKGAGSSG